MGNLHEDQYTFLIIFRWSLFRMRNVSDKSCRWNQNTYFIFNNFFCFENHAVYETTWEKYCRARQATDENTVHAHFMLDTWFYKQTPGICNTYCSSTATMVARTRLNVTMYIVCLSVLLNISQLKFVLRNRLCHGSSFSPQRF